MKNRKTADAAVAQVNYGRVGSLVHDNGKPLTEESRPYLEALDREIGAWHQRVKQELFRLDRAVVKGRAAIFVLFLVLAPGLARAQPPITVTGRMNTPQEALEILRANTSTTNMTNRVVVVNVPRIPSPTFIVKSPVVQQPASSLPPLNCCSRYDFPLPVPRLDIRILK